MHRNPSVSAHQFAMVPRADIPRSSFRMQTTHKTTFSAAFLIPVFLQEVLPGDMFNLQMTAFTRMATPIFPIMDNLYLESFFFFVPNRLVFDQWVQLMGEQANPADSISYLVPTVQSSAGGFARMSIYDYFGLPCAPNLGANTISVNSLPLRSYNLIWNQWFRDENLVDQKAFSKGLGPDLESAFTLLRRGKRHDYFTSALPFTQKGNAVFLPLTGQATVRTAGTDLLPSGPVNPLYFTESLTRVTPPSGIAVGTGSIAGVGGRIFDQGTGPALVAPFDSGLTPTNLYADLSTATSTTINALRQSFQIQRLLERDARGGTRYTEIVRNHFGVQSPDARLQRAEYLGGGSSPINIMPVAQQSQTGLTGGATPLGTLAAVGTGLARGHGFHGAFTEHGHIIGLVNVRADLSYQQGVRKLWFRSTRYDFYFPVFAHLGEQAVLNKEIYATGDLAQDNAAFGYQERWAEYRYHPSMITGFFNSTDPTPLDSWHLSQKFGTLPVLNTAFIQDTTDVILQRNLAAGALSNNQQFLADFFFDVKAARPMPLYSVPGLIDHF